MTADLGAPLTQLRVDGGAARNNLLMQRQADLLGVDCVRPQVLETTGLGSALLAGIAAGVWSDATQVSSAWREERRFTASGDPDELSETRARWALAVERA
jgi:glycerol kinase